jgi:stage II sporulation protein D
LAQNKKVVRSYYHADCGGQTIPAGKVWYGAMDLGTAVDPWCARRTQNQWEHSVPLSFFESKQTYTAAYFRNKIVRFENEGIQKIRQLFGFSKIRNSPETVEVSESEVTFKGRGFGHGVGLCQWGSLYMARKGRGYLDILTHYYPKAEIININTLEFKNYLTNSENPKTISRR